MELEILKQVPQLGIGVAAVIVLYLCFKIFVAALNTRDTAFKSFVEANNHRSVEVMTECRDAIRDAAANIRESTEIQKQVVGRMITNNRRN
jgi:hypothetical protein